MRWRGRLAFLSCRKILAAALALRRAKNLTCVEGEPRVAFTLAGLQCPVDDSSLLSACLVPCLQYVALCSNHKASWFVVEMAPGILEHPSIACTESRPSKRIRLSAAEEFQNDDEDVAIALPLHPLGVKPAGNAYTASESIKSRCGSFARLPDELLSHILESFDADTLIRLGSTCRALYAFTRLDDLWRALFVRYVLWLIYCSESAYLAFAFFWLCQSYLSMSASSVSASHSRYWESKSRAVVHMRR